MRTTPHNIERFAEFADSGRVVVFDTETTGGSCTDEICQLAAAEYVNGRLERTMNVYIRPTCEMNPWAGFVGTGFCGDRPLRDVVFCKLFGSFRQVVWSVSA